MKLKNVLLGLALLVSTVALAQEKGDFNGFAGLVYPLESDSVLGITGGVEYVFAEDISFAPSFTYYFSEGETLTQLDFDLRYYLGNDNFNYFLSGGFASVSSNNSQGFGITLTGLTVGGGALFSIGESFDLITQVKYNAAWRSVIPMLGVSFVF